MIYTLREDMIASMCRRPSWEIHNLLRSRLIRLTEFLKYPGLEFASDRETVMVMEAAEALRRMGEEPVLHS